MAKSEYDSRFPDVNPSWYKKCTTGNFGSEDFKYCYGKIEWENGAVFEGAICKTKPHGSKIRSNVYAEEGKITWPDGSILKIVAGGCGGNVYEGLYIGGEEIKLMIFDSYRVAKIKPTHTNGKLVELPPPINPNQLILREDGTYREYEPESSPPDQPKMYSGGYWDFTYDGFSSCDEWIDHHECVGTINFSDGSTYNGVLTKIDDKEIGASGQGVITYADGSILKASWQMAVGEWNVNDHTKEIDGEKYSSILLWPAQYSKPEKGRTIKGVVYGHNYKIEHVYVLRGYPPNEPSINGKYEQAQNLPEKVFVGGGYDPKNEKKSNKPDVDERKDPPKTYRAQNDNELLPAASGSGFAISKDGYVLTNNHVINGCQALNIHTNGKLISARLIASDPINDLALIKGSFKPQTVFYINTSTPKLLDDIYVAGYPFGYAISSSIKITKGIVSSLSGIGDNFSQMQIDAAIQPGNSGGPVVDKKGNVVGIVVAKLNMEVVYEDYGVIPENTNFAIKSTTAKSFAESNNIRLISKSSYKNKELGRYISNGTYYLSCMMTMARIKEMKTEKVFFKNIIK